MLRLTPPSYEKIRMASSALKHTIRGDANLTDDVTAIRNLMNMNDDIKR